MTPAPASAPSTGERLTREVKRLQATMMKEATPTLDVWAGGVGDSAMSFTASSPMVMMGNAKAASQTYNAGALFTNNATALSKG